MNRNTESHFANLPTISIGRSKFNREHTNKTTFNTAELVPVYVDMDIIPGDTVSMKQSEIVRMMTPIAPVMDNAFMDFYWFFVPNRLVWDNFKMMMGENETAPWTQTVEKTIPQIKITNDARQNRQGTYYVTRDIKKGSVLNHMGIPISTWGYKDDEGEVERKIEISALPTRAYCLIWNEFFRDENLQNPVNISKGDATGQCTNEYNVQYVSDPIAYSVTNEQYGGLPCLKVCKPHDYFTSALPGMQKLPNPVTIPLSTTQAPIKVGQYYNTTDDEWQDYETESHQMVTGTTAIQTNSGGEYVVGPDDDPTSFSTLPVDEAFKLYTDLSSVTGATVTALRQAFAIQKFYERDARGGWACA